MKLATYNICHCANFENWDGGEEPINVKRTAEAISEIDADIIGLNEVYAAGDCEDFELQEEKLAKLAGYPYYVFAQAAEFPWSTIGNAILSKYPIVSVKKIIVSVPTPEERNPDENEWYEDRVLLCAEIEVDGKNIYVISTHFGLNRTEVIRIVEAVCKEIDTHSEVVLMGDLNLLPDSEFLEPLYARLKSSAKEMGNTEYTFSTYAPQVQIDYIFVPKTAKIKEYTVYKNKVSDHRPISAEIEF